MLVQVQGLHHRDDGAMFAYVASANKGWFGRSHVGKHSRSHTGMSVGRIYVMVSVLPNNQPASAKGHD